MSAQHRPILDQMRPGEWQEHQAGPDPSDTRQRHWWHMAGDVAAQHDIASPEQRRQAQEQIGLMVEPADGIKRWRLACVHIDAADGFRDATKTPVSTSAKPMKWKACGRSPRKTIAITDPNTGTTWKIGAARLAPINSMPRL